MNWPLGNTALRCPAAMINLLGEPGYEGAVVVEGLAEAMSEKGVFIHLYGKKYTKPFRKMGHVTLLGEAIEEVKDKAQRIKDLIKIKSQQ
jgi:5-(carboxyamino)imidazole ribonucleotide synthase